MKTLSVKNLKKNTRTICEFTGAVTQFGDTTTVGTDPTTTTVTVLTTTHLK